MKPEEYRRGKALRVFWEDSTHSAGWRYEENPPVHIEDITSLGYVVNTSPFGLSLTTTLSDAGGILAYTSIPWGCIREIQDLPDWDENLSSA